jgi:hypothetical protein
MGLDSNLAGEVPLRNGRLSLLPRVELQRLASAEYLCCDGGYDMLHLSGHLESPDLDDEGETVDVTWPSADDDDCLDLQAPSYASWYQTLRIFLHGTRYARVTISGIGELGTFRADTGAPYLSPPTTPAHEAEAPGARTRSPDPAENFRRRLVWTKDQITITPSPATELGSGDTAGSISEPSVAIPAQTGDSQAGGNDWPEDPEEVERRLTSSVAVAQFARDAPDLHDDHRKRLVSEAIWFWTERGRVSRKYKLRFRTPAALKLQHELGFTAAAKQLAHEHVHERAAVVLRLLAPDTDIRAVLQATEACVVTRDEHHQLASAKGVSGWSRYTAIHLHPIDMVTGLPMDLPAAVAADSVAWPGHG